MLMLNVPATVGLVVLGVPIVRVIFERGAFKPNDTLATATALQLYAVGLIGYSLVRIASPVFYALGRSRVPVIVSAVAVLVNAVLSILLVRTIGFAGLALGTSCAALFNATVLFVLLRRSIGGLNERRLIGSALRIVVASIAMGATAFAVDRWLSASLPQSRLVWQITQLAATIGAALIVLAGAAWALRIEEFKDSVQMVLRRLRRPSA
jgi:putative peptidoglycan lipid II flippase